MIVGDNAIKKLEIAIVNPSILLRSAGGVESEIKANDTGMKASKSVELMKREAMSKGPNSR